jgi:GGDEF domain-containing protein
MVSIGRTLTELERAYQIRRMAVDSYHTAVRSAAEYVVELDSEITEPHRRRLEQVAGRFHDNATDQVLAESGAELRDAFRSYHDEAAAFLNRLREDLAAKAASLQRIFEAMMDGDGDHDQRLRTTLKQLREIASRPAAAGVNAAICLAADSLESSLKALKQHHRLIVAQFQMEIQVLHQRIQSMELAAAVDRGTNLASRRDFEERLAPSLASLSPFYLLLLRIRNLATAKRQLGEEVERSLIDSFAKRLRNCMSADALAARWDEERFVVLQAGGKRESIPAAKRVSEHVNGTYVSTAGGKLVRPVLKVDVGTVEIAPGERPDRAIARIEVFFRAMD